MRRLREYLSEHFETTFRGFTVLCAAVVLIIMAAMFFNLAWNARLAIGQFGLGFLWRDMWDPALNEYGALSSIYGTVVSTVIAMTIAVPMSVVIALFLVELAHPTVSKVVGAAIELLAAIPSIIYGMWGLFVFAPLMAETVQPFLQETLGLENVPGIGRLFTGAPMGIGMLTSGIILAIMILPFISAVMRDVFAMVPAVVKESAYGMGSTTWEVTRKVTLRYGIQGVVGACFLGLGRAIGETMAVTFVIGNAHRISLSLYDPGNSIASTIANEFAEASDPLYLQALIYLGLVLLVMTFVIQMIAQWWVVRLKKSMGAGL